MVGMKLKSKVTITGDYNIKNVMIHKVPNKNNDG